MKNLMCFLKHSILVLSFIFTFFILSFAEVSDKIPKTINVQGKLTTDSGQPISGSTNVTLSIYSDSTGPTPVVSKTESNVTVDSDGLYNTNIDLTSFFNEKKLDFNNQYYFEIEANGVSSKRTPFSSSPNAFHASTSTYALVLSPTTDVKLVDGNFNPSIVYTIKVATASYSVISSSMS